MEQPIFRIQRFAPGHEFYTLASIIHEGKEYQSVFGQCVDANGNFLHYTLERKDTLIDEGEYDFDLYYSNKNKCVVPRLTMFNGKDISSRELEHHIANFSYELGGCCAHGKKIDLKNSMLQTSGVAFHEFMNLIVPSKTGKIIYETLKPNII